MKQSSKENTERVLQLQKTLKPMPLQDEIFDMVSNEHYADFDWYYGSNEMECSFTESVEEYIVIRGCVLNVVETSEYDMNGLHCKTSYEEYSSAIYPKTMEETEEIEETLEQYLDTANEGDFFQIWINLNTREVVRLRNVNDEGNTYVEGTRWEITDIKYDCQYRANMLNHPILQKLAVKSIDEFSYYDYDCYEFFAETSEEDFLINLCSNAFYRELYNEGCFKLLQRYNDNQHYIQLHKIARRHNYTINKENREMWLDMIDNLRYIGKDIHNPKFLLPDDLPTASAKWKAEYNRVRAHRAELLERERRRIAEEQAKKDMERAMEIIAEASKESTAYVENMNNFFDLEIVGGDYVITPLKSVKEFYEEGLSMNHCVFKMGYYKKFNSLILSVKDKNGERVATVEYNLTNGNIVQCYAYGNKAPEDGQTIRQLITDNKQLINEHKRSA